LRVAALVATLGIIAFMIWRCGWRSRPRSRSAAGGPTWAAGSHKPFSPRPEPTGLPLGQHIDVGPREKQLALVQLHESTLRASLASFDSPASAITPPAAAPRRFLESSARITRWRSRATCCASLSRGRSAPLGGRRPGGGRPYRGGRAREPRRRSGSAHRQGPCRLAVGVTRASELEAAVLATQALAAARSLPKGSAFISAGSRALRRAVPQDRARKGSGRPRAGSAAPRWRERSRRTPPKSSRVRCRLRLRSAPAGAGVGVYQAWWTCSRRTLRACCARGREDAHAGGAQGAFASRRAARAVIAPGASSTKDCSPNRRCSAPIRRSRLPAERRGAGARALVPAAALDDGPSSGAFLRDQERLQSDARCRASSGPSWFMRVAWVRRNAEMLGPRVASVLQTRSERFAWFERETRSFESALVDYLAALPAATATSSPSPSPPPGERRSSESMPAARRAASATPTCSCRVSRRRLRRHRRSTCSARQSTPRTSCATSDTCEAAMSTESFDAVIVGSGFGGSVMAYRLREAGLSVCLLERGKAYPPALSRAARTR